jgi:integrase
MPKYKKDINRIVTEEDTRAMISKVQSLRDSFMVAIMDFSGARPDELRRIEKKDINLRADGCLEIKLHTSKLGTTGEFLINERILTMKPEMNFYSYIKNYWESSPEGKLLDLTVRRIEQLVEELSDGKFCPYNFRHSRLTKLARIGASIDQLMYWKGSKDLRSISPYIRGKKVEFERIE